MTPTALLSATSREKLQVQRRAHLTVSQLMDICLQIHCQAICYGEKKVLILRYCGCSISVLYTQVQLEIKSTHTLPHAQKYMWAICIYDIYRLAVFTVGKV